MMTIYSIEFSISMWWLVYGGFIHKLDAGFLEMDCFFVCQI